MSKHLYLIPALLLLSLFSYAQSLPQIRRIGKPVISKQELKIMNRELQNRLDSLQFVVDSLNEYNSRTDTVEVSPEEPAAGKPLQEYTQEEQDSLLSMWYKNSKVLDFDTVHEYDMDSVRFTSDVSDEEMIRRLTDMKAFITLPFNETVKNYMILYSEKMPSTMGRALGLSEYYFPIFEEVLARYDLPQELKYMSIIESMLNPTATSRAGARGIWQFMYKTARGYGLNIDSFVDERLDVEKAMDAAARYMKDAYNVFGDWCLAISSYNCGAGNVVKAIRRAGGGSNFWDVYPYLPRETRGYMPAMVGAMYAFRYYKEYGLSPSEVGMPVQTDTFEIRKMLHFQQINDVVGVPMEDLQNLNPQYIHDIIPGGNDGVCILKLPYKWSGPFLNADQDSLYLHKKSELLSEDVVKDASTRSNEPQRTSYKVKSGDNLGKIALRNHTTVANLKKWNHLRSDNIRIGQILYIYR